MEAGAWPSDCRDVTDRREKASQPHLRTKNLEDQATHYEGTLSHSFNAGLLILEL